MDMLYAALVEVMPSADLARTGADGWRGYQIRRYRDLAGGHFFCQIYTSEPQILLLEEFYNYGGFFYPWRLDHDLLEGDFFLKDAIGQKAHLVRFIRSAVDQALEWQNSKKRKEIVPAKLLMGKTYGTETHLELPDTLRQISKTYIAALQLQSSMLGHLQEQVETLAHDVGLRKPYLKFNQSGWDYRGLWMKLRTTEPDEVTPEGSFPFKWKIEFSNPSKLLFEGLETTHLLDLEKHYFFTLDKKNQEKTLRNFIRPIMTEIKAST
jgi:hypothetical protein